MAKQIETTEKKQLPPHIVALMKKAEEYEAKKQAMFGCQIIDRTPAGFGPKG